MVIFLRMVWVVNFIKFKVKCIWMFKWCFIFGILNKICIGGMVFIVGDGIIIICGYLFVIEIFIL